MDDGGRGIARSQLPQDAVNGHVGALKKEIDSATESGLRACKPLLREHLSIGELGPLMKQIVELRDQHGGEEVTASEDEIPVGLGERVTVESAFDCFGGVRITSVADGSQDFDHARLMV